MYNLHKFEKDSLLKVFGLEYLSENELSINKLINNKNFMKVINDYTSSEPYIKYCKNNNSFEEMLLLGLLLGIDVDTANNKFNVIKSVLYSFSSDSPCACEDGVKLTFKVLCPFLKNNFNNYKWNLVNDLDSAFWQNTIDYITVDDDKDYIEERKVLCAILVGLSVQYSNKSIVHECIETLNKSIASLCRNFKLEEI